MKGKMKPVIGCTVSALALSMFTSAVAFAYPSTLVGAGVGMQTSETEQQESTDTTSTGAAVTEDKWTYRSVADVDTAINIRSNTSTESRIVGVLPKAGVADVIDKGEEWTYIKSGDIEGYVKTDYLAFGDDAKELAEVYGEQGVEASWNDVNIFESADPASKIVRTVNEGEELQVLNREGHWYFVQLNADTMAYVPAEDVEETLLLDKAVPYSTGSETGSQGAFEGAYVPADTNGSTDSNAGEGQTEGNGYTDGTSTGQSSQTEAPQTDYTEQTEAPYTEAPQTEYTEQTEAPYTEAPETDYTDQTEAPYTEAPQTEYTEAPETEYIDQTEAPYTEAPQTEYTEAPETDYIEETEAPQTEAPQTEGTEASGSDVDLLAAIIYCEAGNQSREGKVAVGAVVMHRVYSDSFPNNIHDLIYQSGQFTPAYSGSLASALANGVPSDCYEAAQAALSGEDPVPGMYYFNTAYGSVKIGAHWFS